MAARSDGTKAATTATVADVKNRRATKPQAIPVSSAAVVNPETESAMVSV
ncbi:MAG: hypothetical protein Cons2KO_13470 [Congregibacter sp.]